MIAAWIESHAPPRTAAAGSTIVTLEAFNATEALAVEHAAECRKREFFEGRRLARAALSKLGHSAADIPRGDYGAPIWPLGFVGTISHTKSYCVAHVGHDCDLLGVGVDIEPNVILDQKLADRICRPDEIASFDAIAEQGVCPILAHFVVKEAFYKAYFPETRCPLDFHDVRVFLDLSKGLFWVHMTNRDKPALGVRSAFEGLVGLCADHIATAIWIGR